MNRYFAACAKVHIALQGFRNKHAGDHCEGETFTEHANFNLLSANKINGMQRVLE